MEAVADAPKNGIEDLVRKDTDELERGDLVSHRTATRNRRLTCWRMMSSVAFSPAEELPDEVMHVYPAGIPPVARTVERHASSAAVVSFVRPLWERSTAAKAESMAALMLSEAGVAVLVARACWVRVEVTTSTTVM